ncbi:flagellin [Bacillus gobiensis]|uniref:flagellin N-terminal helical domain-containing protein n=1 Tax=Bacillus gobiensis TaxID=1441095 RepID=UPI003D20D511
MRINHNIAALNTNRQLTAGSNAASKNMEKLSSGQQINRAGDDAAGLAISEKMRGQIRGLDMASKNAQDGISMVQTAEGALNETQSILQRMRELAVQSSSDTNNNNDRVELQKEVDQLAEEVNRISTDTEFNTKKLINGEATDVTFHIGANAGQNINLSINDMGADTLKVGSKLTAATDASSNKTLNDKDGNVKATWKAAVNEGDVIDNGSDGNPGGGDDTLATASDVRAAGYYDTSDNLVKAANNAFDDNTTLTLGINISDKDSAGNAITTIQSAIDTVSAERSKLGAYQNRLEHTINNLGTSSENLTAAESRIRDTNMAKEMMEFTKNNILSQASQAMLSQANQQPQGVLQLLR